MKQTTNEKPLGPSETAQRFGITVKTLRVYEKAGLLKPGRRPGGWRIYGPDDFARLHAILAMKDMGLSLRQMQSALSQAPQGQLALLKRQALHIDAEIARMTTKRRVINEAVRSIARDGTVPMDKLALLARRDGKPSDPARSSSKVKRQTKTAIVAPQGGIATVLNRAFMLWRDSDRALFETGTALVREPIPEIDDIAGFHAARASIFQRAPEECGSWVLYHETMSPERYSELKVLWPSLDRVEFWVDDLLPNQLAYLRFLHWLHSEGLAPQKLHPVVSSRPIVEVDMDDPIEVPSVGNPISRDTFELGVRAWEALRQPTPENWTALLSNEIDAMPQLRGTILAMLAELPSSQTGLASSEERILRLVQAGENRPNKLFTEFGNFDRRFPLDYYQTGKMLNDMASGGNPLLTGLAEEKFDLALHQDVPELTAYQRFVVSRLSLTPTAQRILDREADAPSVRKIEYWWGGTRLNNSSLWRWNAKDKQLIQPR